MDLHVMKTPKRARRTRVDVSVIVPILREEKTVKRLLDDFRKNVKVCHEVLLIYDQVSDPTVSAVKSYIREVGSGNIQLVKNSVGGGKGAMNAVKTGFRTAKGVYVVVVTADLSDQVSQLDKMYKLASHGWDIVCPSRYMRGGGKIGGPILKSFLSKLAGLSLWYLFGLPTHDATYAFKMYRKELLDRIRIESRGGWEYSLEIVLKAFKSGYRICEFPTVWRERETGRSRFKFWSWLPQYLKQYTIILK